MRIGGRGVARERRWRWVRDSSRIRDGKACLMRAGVSDLHKAMY